MSDNKKYYYLKLKDTFYDSDELKILQSMPEGYLFSDILMKLYLKSLKNNGKLMFKEHIPYKPSMIATVTNHSLSTVEKALSIFKDLGLIVLLDTGEIYMADIQNFIGKSSTEADRKRSYRLKIESEQLTDGQMSGQISDKNPPEIEIEKEIEKEIEIEKEENKENPFVFWDNNFHAITFYEQEQLGSYLDDGIEEDLLTHCLEIAVERNARTLNYVKGILNKYLSNNVKTLKAALSADEEFKRGKEDGKTRSNGNYKTDSGEVERDGRWDEYTG